MTASLGDRDLSGRRLGPYLLEGLLGEGAFGRVYRARHVDLDAPRAVKVMRAEIAGDIRFRERFLREARTAARLDHPNIVAVHDFAADAEIQYLVMEYVESLTMAEHLQRRPVAGRLDDPVVHRWIREVAAALDQAHELGIVHRDLKPANVLIRTRDGRAMLTDFGIAQAANEPSLTLTGRTMGTYAYMSPEQVRGMSDLTGAVDIYAFAAMLVEIATGEPPFGRGMAAVGGHLTSPAPALEYGGPEVARRLSAVLAVGLAKEPADRYRTAGELAEAVLEVVSAAPREDAPAKPAPVEVTEPAELTDAERTVASPWTVLPGSSVAPAPSQPPAAPASAAAAGPADLVRRLTAPVRRRRLALPAAGGAVLLLAGLVAGVATLGPHAPAPQPPAVSPPAPVTGTIGSPFRVAGLALTVLTVSSQAPPPNVQATAADRLVVVLVRCRADGSGPGIVTPYDWSVIDASGAVYRPVVDGVGQPLAEKELRSGQTIEGRIGFVVPRAAQGLTLHFGAELGDEAGLVPIP
jgi:serine/threonine-protein kinase